MQYCTHCGKPNPETAKFCTSCGIKLGVQNDRKEAPDLSQYSNQEKLPGSGSLSGNNKKWLIFGIAGAVLLGIFVVIYFTNRKGTESSLTTSGDTTTVITQQSEMSAPYTANGSNEQKIFFYSSPDESTRRSAYINSPVDVIVKQIQNNFGFIKFINERGQESDGWVHMQYLSLRSGNSSSDNNSISTTNNPEPAQNENPIRNLNASLDESQTIFLKLKTLYDNENLGNVQGIVSNFSFPIARYYNVYNISIDSLSNLYIHSFNETLQYHRITPDWHASSIEKINDNYKINLIADYQFILSKKPEEQKNRRINIIVIMNSNYEISSVYENQ